MQRASFRAGVLFIGLLQAAALGQIPLVPRSQLREGQPFAMIDAVNFRATAPGQSRLDLRIKIAHDDLQFIKLAEELYQAVYEMTIIVQDEDEFQVAGKTIEDTLRVQNFSNTNSMRGYRQASFSFSLAPGKYEVQANLLDRATAISRLQKQRIELRDFSGDQLQISDILITDAPPVATAKVANEALTPTSSQPSPSAPLYAFYEIYDRSAALLYEVIYTIKTVKGHKIFQESASVQRHAEVTPAHFALPREKIGLGEYEIFIKASSGQRSAASAHRLNVPWQGAEAALADLEEAIKPMTYLVAKADFKKIKEAPQEKRHEAFIEFWCRQDPTPSTEFNESMEEFYRRVWYANKYFSSPSRPGWKTDMGMIYVVMGSPDAVSDSNVYSRRPRGRQVRTQAQMAQYWIYQRPRRTFVFLDRSGFGDYYLHSPWPFDPHNL